MVGVGFATVVEASSVAAVVTVTVVVVSGAVAVVMAGVGVIVVVRGPSPAIPSPWFGVSRSIRGLSRRKRSRLWGFGFDVGLAKARLIWA